MTEYDGVLETVTRDIEKEHLERDLECLYRASQILGESLQFGETLIRLLQVLHETTNLQHGMIALRERDSDELIVTALYSSPTPSAVVRYKAGEGILGETLRSEKPVMLSRISDDTRFLDKLGVYDPDLPFIGVPIQSSGSIVGVLSAQPVLKSRGLKAYQRIMEMVSSLIGQSVRLSRKIEDEKLEIKSERDNLRRKVRQEHGFSNMVGRARNIRLVFDQIRQVSKWDTTVLVRGESGTGKELVANAIHYNSPRAQGPFIKLNCAALPDTLLESELFGHEKGAFTGAVSQRKGRFERADGGTIFLDEIGEISPVFQAKLLRVLQEGEFERVGASRSTTVDVRIVAATNKNLEEEVREGNFREDLYYRLNVMPILMPALRERSEDIPELAKFIVSRIGKTQNRELSIRDSAIALLMRHDWPGNVRELQNCLERSSVMSEDGVIDGHVINLSGLQSERQSTIPLSNGGSIDIDDPDLDERERVIAALEHAGWVQAKAARLLGMTPRQIGYRIQTLGIKVKQL